MTNYDCYFGTQERAIDTLANLLEYPYDHPRQEVREFHDEIRKAGATKWLQAECTNQRWWSGMKLGSR